MDKRDPTDVLSVEVMFGIVKDSKCMQKSRIYDKYMPLVKSSHVKFLEDYVERICR